MNEHVVPSERFEEAAHIDEAGFAAMIRLADDSAAAAGVLGHPRIDPTRAGLSIEDSQGAALDAIIMAIVAECARRERRVNDPRSAHGAESLSRDLVAGMFAR